MNEIKEKEIIQNSKIIKTELEKILDSSTSYFLSLAFSNDSTSEIIKTMGNFTDKQIAFIIYNIFKDTPSIFIEVLKLQNEIEEEEISKYQNEFCKSINF